MNVQISISPSSIHLGATSKCQKQSVTTFSELLIIEGFTASCWSNIFTYIIGKI